MVSGEYSDYHTICACPSKADAERLVKRMGGRVNLSNDDDYCGVRVEELKVVKGNVKKVTILTMWATISDPDGVVTNENSQTTEEWPFRASREPVAAGWEWERVSNWGWLRVHGINHKLVQKIYGEQRMMLIAEPARRVKSYKGKIDKTRRGR